MKIINENAYNYFVIPTGGTTREWTKRYAAMIAKYEIIEQMATTKKEKEFLAGYLECINTFHRETRPNRVKENLKRTGR